MKITTILTACSLLLSTVSPLTAAEQSAPAPEETAITDAQQQALQEYIRLQKDCLNALRGVCNKETADAAAALSRQQEKRLDALADLFVQMDPETVQSTLSNSGIGRNAIKKEMNRLLLADFYGSAALSEVVMESPVHALPAQELPAAIQQELEKRAQDALLFREKLGQFISGGSGFTQQTAWVLTHAPDIHLPETCTVLAGYLYPNSNMLETAGLESSAFYSEKLFTDNKALIRLCVDIIPTGDSPTARYRFNQWFDVSALVPFRSETELKQAVARLLSTLQQLSELADGIHDKATADAAAERIAELMTQGREQVRGLRWLTEDEFAQLVSKDNTNMMDNLISPFLKLQEANYFNSEKLQKVLHQKLNQ